MHPGTLEPFTIAAAQVTPVYLDRAATVAKACEWIAEAGRQGVRLIVFPEVFVPGYPDWVWAVPPGESRTLGRLYSALLANSVDVPGEETEALCRAAKAARVNVVIGVNERNVEASGTSLYNTVLTIDEHGALLGRHRKLVPTGPERLVWAQGDGSTLEAHDTPVGRLGALTCWENYMPLARYSMYAWGVQLYAAPTWDRGEPWTSTLRHIAKEGRVYVAGCCMPVRRDDLPDGFDLKERWYPADREWINVGGSAIVSPDGAILAGPAERTEELLLAEVDPEMLRGPRWILDVAGHYARPDVFQLTVNRESRAMIRDAAPREAPATAPAPSNGTAGNWALEGRTDGVREA